jgi:hypothetical protein
MLKILKMIILFKQFRLKPTINFHNQVKRHCRRMYNEELRNLYTSTNIIRVTKLRRTRWAGHSAHMGGMRNAYKVVVAKPPGKKPLRRCRHRWEDNIRTDLRETGQKMWTIFIWLRTGTSGRLL